MLLAGAAVEGILMDFGVFNLNVVIELYNSGDTCLSANVMVSSLCKQGDQSFLGCSHLWEPYSLRS